MSITRKFNRNRLRRDRRRETPARRGDETGRKYVVVTGPTGLGDPSEPESCSCPVCAYLDSIDAEAETLDDGTVIHSLSAQQRDEVTALMANMPIDV